MQAMVVVVFELVDARMGGNSHFAEMLAGLVRRLKERSTSKAR